MLPFPFKVVGFIDNIIDLLVIWGFNGIVCFGNLETFISGLFYILLHLFLLEWLQRQCDYARMAPSSVTCELPSEINLWLPHSFAGRVFVNRSLAMERIKCFGFDMDYTLASKHKCNGYSQGLAERYTVCIRQVNVRGPCHGVNGTER